MDEGPPPKPTPGSREWHELVKQIFTDALDVPREKRAAFIAAACHGDEQLWREVLELFLRHGEPDPVLDAPVDSEAVLAGLSQPAGALIGPYRVVRRLGQGGMGVVYLAERDGEQFAVKQLAAGAFSPELRERFRLEAEILGKLHHEGIARVVDVGEDPRAGGVAQPWIAMEYVDGVSLLEYAEREQLELDRRLALLSSVCDAVQHAHSQGIVHRDLKPANILVRSDGRPAVLDFGVARLMGGDERPTELLTRTGQLLGTPQYMSPEQVQAEPANITPSSDVYSLGVIAFELCAGRPPYEAASASLHRAIAIILFTEPPRLGQLERRFRGALEHVVSKALEKKPADRYADAGALARDLDRKLAGRPVGATPSLSRRMLRWSRRRRRVAAGALALLLVLAGLLTGTWLVTRIRAKVTREHVLATYREAETLVLQAIPLLYEGERTPSRLQRAIDDESRARTLLDQVPALRHHDLLMRLIEKDLGTAEFLLGEQTFDVEPYRTASMTLEHAIHLGPDTTAGWRQDVQSPQLRDMEIPQRDLYGLLATAYLGQFRLWGESNAAETAESEVWRQRAEVLRLSGPPIRVTPEVKSYPYAFVFNSLTEVTDDLAAFRADSALARRALLYSDSAIARRLAFLHDWPALGSVLFERGRAFRTYGALTGSHAAFDSSARYLRECADYRGPERPWVFAQTRQEMASLALDRARLTAEASRRAALLQDARLDVDTALRVLRTTELPAAAAATFLSLDAELLAELSIARGRPSLLDEAEARLHEAARAFPSTALPREAAWVCVRQAVIERARFASSGDGRELAAGAAALARADVLVEAHGDSLVMYRVRTEREALRRARASRPV